MLQPYLKEIFKVAQLGDAREESYYSTLDGLLNGYAKSIGKTNIHITTLPKKTDAGNPDFRVWDGKQHIVGYIEAKSPTVENLNQIETTEQLKRYRQTFPNLILTNFLEFRLYRNGKLIDKVPFDISFDLHKPKTIPKVEKEPDFLNLLDKFFSFSLPKVYDAKNLAIELAKRTRFLKEEVIAQELKEEEETKKGFILGFYEAFRKYLISGLTKEDFADLYAQTITYGLFAARTRSENGFNRKLAYYNIPHTIGILRDVFQFVSLGDLPYQMEWIIDDISEVLTVTDVKNILHQYFHEGKGKDPIVHFYETFLAEYDPKKRKSRGVYYTPEAVVSYIVRSLNLILKEHFGRKEGFANESITVLDPAAGTLTFLAEAIKLAMEEFVSKYGEGGKENFIKEHVLKKNFYAFELMMAPYAVGHLKMSFLLEELGYKLQKEDRFNLYLTNTLEMEELAQTELPGMVSLSEESHLAGKVKKETPILVILGNPPYSSSVSSGTSFINEKIKDYLKGLGVEQEKKKGVIQDDYIRFIRFAHWKIEQNGKGILGFITNNSYLDGTIHRAMRKKLIDSFDKIYILNLHGNARIKETCLDGSKDENVFDIQQGVCIGIFINTGKQKQKTEVYYSDLRGKRKEKYVYLENNDNNTTKWEKLSPEPPYFFLKFIDLSHENTYNKFKNLTDILVKYSSGIETEKDKFAVAFNKLTLKNRLLTFANSKIPDETISASFKLKNTPNWNINKARQLLFKQGIKENLFVEYCYHTFDCRWTYYSDAILTRSRKPIMENMFKENLALLTMRQVKGEEYKHCFVTDKISNKFSLSSKSSNVSYHFPLFMYFDIEKKDLFSLKEEPTKKTPNIAFKLFTVLSKVYKKEPTSEDIFYYIYAILYSNIYRTKYAEFLKKDFPKIPFTKNYELFCKVAEHGRMLIDLHLLKSPKLNPPNTKFQGKGDNGIGRFKYSEKERRVYINQNQYFEGIVKDVWQYQIGGYQVCDKWLKDRKKETLSLDDIKRYCKIVTSLERTIEIQKLIDEIYPEVEKDTIEFVN
jgi:hypothetical protein